MNLMLWLGLCCSFWSLPEPDLQRFDFSQRLMGISFDITIYAADEPTATAAAEAAFGRIRKLNAIFSDYEPQSELNRLCKTAGQGQAIPVSPELFSILETSLEISRQTNGEFDVSIGPLVRLWRTARRTRQMPTAEQIAAARALVDYRQIKLDRDHQTVELTKAGMRLDLGGIAVGYACDDVLRMLRNRGLTRVMIDGSGDIVCGEPPPGKEGWVIGLAPETADGPPSRFVRLHNAAVSTSGDAFQFVEFDGVRYSHIVDPATGLGLTDQSTVTVVAKDCLTVDVWSTSISLLGPVEGLKALQQVPDAGVIILRNTGTSDKLEVTESDGLKQYLIPTPATPAE